MNPKKTFVAISTVVTLLVVAGCQGAEEAGKTTEKASQSLQNATVNITEPMPGENGAMTEQGAQTAKPVPSTFQYPDMGTQQDLKAPEMKFPTEPQKTTAAENNTTQQIIEKGLKEQSQNNS